MRPLLCLFLLLVAAVEAAPSLWYAALNSSTNIQVRRDPPPSRSLCSVTWFTDNPGLPGCLEKRCHPSNPPPLCLGRIAFHRTTWGRGVYSIRAGRPLPPYQRAGQHTWPGPGPSRALAHPWPHWLPVHCLSHGHRDLARCGVAPAPELELALDPLQPHPGEHDLCRELDLLRGPLRGTGHVPAGGTLRVAAPQD